MLRNKNIMVPRETGSLRPKEDRPNLDLMYFYKNEDSLINMGGVAMITRMQMDLISFIELL